MLNVGAWLLHFSASTSPLFKKSPISPPLLPTATYANYAIGAFMAHGAQPREYASSAKYL